VCRSYFVFSLAARFQQEAFLSEMHAGQPKRDEGTAAQPNCCCKHNFKAGDCKYAFVRDSGEDEGNAAATGKCCQKLMDALLCRTIGPRNTVLLTRRRRELHLHQRGATWHTSFRMEASARCAQQIQDLWRCQHDDLDALY
jgi:hypothetical protein